MAWTDGWGEGVAIPESAPPADIDAVTEPFAAVAAPIDVVRGVVRIGRVPQDDIMDGTPRWGVLGALGSANPKEAYF